MYRIDISPGGLRAPSPETAGVVGCVTMMGLRPEMLRASGSASRVAGEIDYTLARNSVVKEYHRGRLSRLDVCDAHPELMRAATNVGQETELDCPICAEAKVRLVSFVFGSRLPPSGTCVTSGRELDKLSRSAKDLACYVVEVCPCCAWNHLTRSFAISPRRLGRE